MRLFKSMHSTQHRSVPIILHLILQSLVPRHCLLGGYRYGLTSYSTHWWKRQPQYVPVMILTFSSIVRAVLYSWSAVCGSVHSPLWSKYAQIMTPVRPCSQHHTWHLGLCRPCYSEIIPQRVSASEMVWTVRTAARTQIYLLTIYQTIHRLAIWLANGTYIVSKKRKEWRHYHTEKNN